MAAALRPWLLPIRRLASFVEVEIITRVRAEWIGVNRLVLE